MDTTHLFLIQLVLSNWIVVLTYGGHLSRKTSSGSYSRNYFLIQFLLVYFLYFFQLFSSATTKQNPSFATGQQRKLEDWNMANGIEDFIAYLVGHLRHYYDLLSYS